jgi:hypothetical protein
VIVVRHIPISTELITKVFVLNCGFAYELVADTELPAEISVKRHVGMHTSGTLSDCGSKKTQKEK